MPSKTCPQEKVSYAHTYVLVVLKLLSQREQGVRYCFWMCIAFICYSLYYHQLCNLASWPYLMHNFCPMSVISLSLYTSKVWGHFLILQLDTCISNICWFWRRTLLQVKTGHCFAHCVCFMSDCLTLTRDHPWTSIPSFCLSKVMSAKKVWSGLISKGPTPEFHYALLLHGKWWVILDRVASLSGKYKYC